MIAAWCTYIRLCTGISFWTGQGKQIEVRQDGLFRPVRCTTRLDWREKRRVTLAGHGAALLWLTKEFMITQSSPPDSRSGVAFGIRYISPFPGGSAIGPTKAPSHLENTSCADNRLDAEPIRPGRQVLGEEVKIAGFIKDSYGLRELLPLSL